MKIRSHGMMSQVWIFWPQKIKLSNVRDCDDQQNEFQVFKLYIKTTQMGISWIVNAFPLTDIFSLLKNIQFFLHAYNSSNVCYIPLIQILLWLQCVLFQIHEKLSDVAGPMNPRDY